MSVSVVLMTAPSAEQAAALAKVLVEERLIACANIVPGVRSIYEWEGKLCDEAEVLVVMKSTAEAFARLERRVRALHPYQVPEVLQLEVTAGSQPYLDWVTRSLAP